MISSQKVVEIIQDVLGNSTMVVGRILKHPDGRVVQIKSGCYLDPIYGRVSNFWYWNEVLEDGSLGKDECGYGW